MSRRALTIVKNGQPVALTELGPLSVADFRDCLLYTSDAADE